MTGFTVANQPGNKRTDNEKKTDWQDDLITTDIYYMNNTKLQINVFYFLAGLEECDTCFFLASTTAAISQAYCYSTSPSEVCSRDLWYMDKEYISLQSREYHLYDLLVFYRLPSCRHHIIHMECRLNAPRPERQYKNLDVSIILVQGCSANKTNTL